MLILLQLVHDDLLLAPAICADEFKDGAFVVSEDYSEEHFVDVVAEYVHPDFVLEDDDNNLMLIRIEQPIVDSKVPINLEEELPIVGADLLVVGYNLNATTKEGFTGVIEESHARSIPQEDCDDSYSGMAFNLVGNTMFCSDNEELTLDSCHENIGSPVVDERGSLVGIVIERGICKTSGVPTVSARVSSFSSFIRDGICSVSAIPDLSCVDSQGSELLTALTTSPSSSGKTYQPSVVETYQPSSGPSTGAPTRDTGVGSSFPSSGNTFGPSEVPPIPTEGPSLSTQETTTPTGVEGETHNEEVHETEKELSIEPSSTPRIESNPSNASFNPSSLEAPGNDREPSAVPTNTDNFSPSSTSTTESMFSSLFSIGSTGETESSSPSKTPPFSGMEDDNDDSSSFAPSSVALASNWPLSTEGTIEPSQVDTSTVAPSSMPLDESPSPSQGVSFEPSSFDLTVAELGSAPPTNENIMYTNLMSAFGMDSTGAPSAEVPIGNAMTSVPSYSTTQYPTSMLSQSSTPTAPESITSEPSSLSSLSPSMASQEGSVAPGVTDSVQPSPSDSISPSTLESSMIPFSSEQVEADSVPPSSLPKNVTNYGVSSYPSPYSDETGYENVTIAPSAAAFATSAPSVESTIGGRATVNGWATVSPAPVLQRGQGKHMHKMSKKMDNRQHQERQHGGRMKMRVTNHTYAPSFTPTSTRYPSSGPTLEAMSSVSPSSMNITAPTTTAPTPKPNTTQMLSPEPTLYPTNARPTHQPSRPPVDVAISSFPTLLPTVRGTKLSPSVSTSQAPTSKPKKKKRPMSNGPPTTLPTINPTVDSLKPTTAPSVAPVESIHEVDTPLYNDQSLLESLESFVGIETNETPDEQLSASSDGSSSDSQQGEDTLLDSLETFLGFDHGSESESDELESEGSDLSKTPDSDQVEASSVDNPMQQQNGPKGSKGQTMSSKGKPQETVLDEGPSSKVTAEVEQEEQPSDDSILAKIEGLLPGNSDQNDSSPGVEMSSGVGEVPHSEPTAASSSENIAGERPEVAVETSELSALELVASLLPGGTEASNDNQASENYPTTSPTLMTSTGVPSTVPTQPPTSEKEDSKGKKQKKPEKETEMSDGKDEDGEDEAADEGQKTTDPEDGNESSTAGGIPEPVEVILQKGKEMATEAYEKAKAWAKETFKPSPCPETDVCELQGLPGIKYHANVGQCLQMCDISKMSHVFGWHCGLCPETP